MVDYKLGTAVTDRHSWDELLDASRSRVNDYLDMPAAIVGRVRAACAHLPEAYEEQAFAGVRWRIRGRTLAHVVTREHEQGVLTSVTFHTAGVELEALVAMGDP